MGCKQSDNNKEGAARRSVASKEAVKDCIWSFKIFVSNFSKILMVENLDITENSAVENYNSKSLPQV